MAFTLMNLETANIVGAYKTEAAALADVADAIRRYGASWREVLTLNLADGPRHIADGRALVERALASSRCKIA